MAPARTRDAFKAYEKQTRIFFFFILARKVYIGSGPRVINPDEKPESKLRLFFE